MFRFWLEKRKLRRQLLEKKAKCYNYYQLLRSLENSRVVVGNSIGGVKDPGLSKNRKDLRKLRAWLEMQSELDRLFDKSKEEK
jgi:hypothetical protein